MKTKNLIIRIFTIVAAIMTSSLLVAQTEWRLTGDAVSGGSVVLTQNPANTQEFKYIGHLNNQWFKITDGTTVYVPLCSETDPMLETLNLRAENNPQETGFRIHYATDKDYFTVTLTVTRSQKQISILRIDPSSSLFIMGGPFNHNATNWLLVDAVELERDTDNPFVFYYRGFIRYNTFGDEPGNIKFLAGRNWDTNYHPAGTANVPLLQATKMRLNGADTKWTIPADRSGDGYYVITLNTLEETIDVKFTSEVGIQPLKADENIKIFASVGSVFIYGKPETRLEAGVFGIDGRKVAAKTFKGHTEIALPTGCYIVKAVSSDNEVVVTKVAVYK